MKKRMENKLEIKTRLIRTFCFSLCRPDLVSFIEDKTSALTSNTLRVASSSGIAVEVKDKLVNAFQQLGIEILGMNQCKGVEFDNNKSLEFLRGGAPTWEIFRFNDPGKSSDVGLMKTDDASYLKRIRCNLNPNNSLYRSFDLFCKNNE